MWQTENDKLYQKFTFKDFDEATEFMNKVAVIAGELNHHPTIQNTYNTVELWLSTHDAGDRRPPAATTSPSAQPFPSETDANSVRRTEDTSPSPESVSARKSSALTREVITPRGLITDKDKAFAKRVDELLVSPKKPSHPSLPKEIKMFADGGSRGNPGPSASGYVLMDMNDIVLVERGIYLGVTTNNQAEYQAVRFGLEDALKRGAREVAVYLDSLLVVNQMKGIFKVKNRDLWPIHAAIHELIKQYKKVTFTHVPRELNKLADAEVNKTLDAEAGVQRSGV